MQSNYYFFISYIVVKHKTGNLRDMKLEKLHHTQTNKQTDINLTRITRALQFGQGRLRIFIQMALELGVLISRILVEREKFERQKCLFL